MLRLLTKCPAGLFLGLLTVALLNSSSAMAQGGYRSTGLMLKTAWPTEELSETHEMGWGVSAVTRSQVTGSRTWWHGQASYMNFKGKEVELPSATQRINSAEIFGLSMGIMAGLTDHLNLGVEGGYFFGDDHSWGVTPFVSITRSNWELMGEYKALGSTKWWGVSLGYYLF